MTNEKTRHEKLKFRDRRPSKVGQGHRIDQICNKLTTSYAHYNGIT